MFPHNFCSRPEKLYIKILHGLSLKLLVYPLVLVMFFGLTISQAQAAKIRISQNGSNSTNTVSITKNNSIQVNQSSSTNNVNTVVVNQSTAGNSVKGNTGGSVSIRTGRNSSTISITNIGSTNISSVSTCCIDDGECPSPTPTPTPTPSPTPMCELETMNASATVSSSQGTLGSGAPITDTDRTNPDNALGSADGQFFSLGDGGSVVYTFSEPAVNVPGTDLTFYEVTNGRDSYPLEKASVEVSNDGVTWYAIGTVSSQDNGTGIMSLDFGSTGLSTVTHVRLTDTTDFGIHNQAADGYDIDAIEATFQDCTQTGGSV